MRKLLKKHPAILFFSILQIFFSAPGQTFLISLFIGPIVQDTGLTLSGFATIYSIATVCAAAMLIPAGLMLDVLPIKTILFVNSSLMAMGCWTLSTATTKKELFVSILMIRLVGQGIFLLTASTTISKVFEKNRGKALGLMTLGFPLSELVFPGIALALSGLWGWRLTFGLFGLISLVFMLPIQWGLIHFSKVKKGEFLPGEVMIQPHSLESEIPHHKVNKHVKLKEAIKNPVFYLVILASCIPPILMTVILFFQSFIYVIHEWNLKWIATALAVYACCKAVASVSIGPYLDREGPLVPFMGLVLMLCFGAGLIIMGGPVIVSFMAYGIMGAALGLSAPVLNMVWANLYGTKHLGSIKGFIGTFRNGLTALGPLPVAALIDRGESLLVIVKWMAIISLIWVFIPIWVNKLNPKFNKKYV